MTIIQAQWRPTHQRKRSPAWFIVITRLGKRTSIFRNDVRCLSFLVRLRSCIWGWAKIGSNIVPTRSNDITKLGGIYFSQADPPSSTSQCISQASQHHPQIGPENLEPT